MTTTPEAAASERQDAHDAATGPLRHVRVLDLSSIVMGPFATQTLADLGADVISVENAEGDGNRQMGPGPHAQFSDISLNLLRNKRSVALDLRDPKQRSVVLDIAASSDVLITSLRPGSLERLGLAYEDIRKVNPRIVYCQAQGFPSDSERRDDPAYDDIIQVASGLADAVGRVGGEPALLPTIVADKVCALTIAYSVLAALLERDRSGIGQHLEVPMVDVMRSFVLVEHGSGAVGLKSAGQPGYRRILTRHRRPSRTQDGWVHILPYVPAHFDAMYRAGGRNELIGDPRSASKRDIIANADFLYSVVHGITPQWTTAQWLSYCKENGIPVTELITLDELVDGLPVAEHPIVGPYRQIPPPVRFSRTPAGIYRHAPAIGGDTAEILEAFDDKG
jgi:crotonobetainyl-CoA:carnitine CoA-transferase CaiB-like acyl-CoA transferase